MQPRFEQTTCPDEANLPLRLSWLITRINPTYHQYLANLLPTSSQDSTYIWPVWSVSCHCSHFPVPVHFAHLCQVHFTAATFHCQQITCIKGFCYWLETYTGKVVLAFITSAQKQAPEGIAVGNKSNFNLKNCSTKLYLAANCKI